MSSTKAPTLAMCPFYVRDHLSGTRSLTLAERGLHTDLLFFEWDTGPLPNDPKRLARMVGVDVEEFKALWPALQSKFVLTEAGIVNERLEQERRKSLNLRTKAAEKAQAAANARWSGNAPRNAPSIKADDSQTSSNAPSNASSNAQSNAPSIKNGATTPENMPGAMLEQCPPSPSPAPSPSAAPPSESLGPRRAHLEGDARGNLLQSSTNGSKPKVGNGVSHVPKPALTTTERMKQSKRHLKCMDVMEKHPEWTNEQVAKKTKIPLDDVVVARRLLQ